MYHISARAQSSTSSVPDTIHVGDPSVDGSFIQPLRITWHSTSISPEGETTPGNTTEEKVEFVEVNGEHLLKFSQAWYNPKGELLYINTHVAEPKSLEQRTFHSLSPNGGIGHIDIRGTKVTGAAAYSPEAETIRFDHTLSEPIFADGLAGLFFASFPLIEGLTVVAPGFGWGGNCAEPCLSWLTFHVVGQEGIGILGQSPIQAWIVEVPGTSGSTIHYWLTKEAPYLLKAVAVSPNGGKRSFEIHSWELED